MKLSKKIILLFFAVGLVLSGIIILLYKAGDATLIPLMIGSITIGIIGIMLSKMFFQPIDRLVQGSEIVRSGNLDYKVGLTTKNKIGQISEAFDHLIENLRQANESIDTLNEENANQKETEKELREQEEYYRRLFEYSNDAVFIYAFDGKILNVNNKACSMLDYSQEELLQIPFSELQPETELSKSKEASKTSTQTGSLRYESIFQKKDGSTIHVEISSSIVDVKKGIMQSIVSNISERKEMEKSLRESEEKFRTFMETASDLMFILDATGCLSYINDSMAMVLGYSRSELIGMPFSEILDKENLENAKIERQQFIEAGENVHHLTWETKTRKKIYGEMKAVAIFDSEGKFQGIRGIFRDVTERKKIEESQRLAQLGKLAADMAHEVNNQIGIILTRAKISLMRSPSDKELEEDLQIILNQCDQIKGIVKRLLMFSKPSKGDFVETDIHDSLDLIVHLIEKQFQQGNVQIEKRFAPLLPLVNIDEKQIQEVFMNLFRNAFEAMAKGGTITVSTMKEDGQIRVDIADTGGGISESDLKNIFVPFFTTKEHGTGLGLSVCWGIIQAHNGDLIYRSKLGEGTTVSIFLPVSKE